MAEQESNPSDVETHVISINTSTVDRSKTTEDLLKELSIEKRKLNEIESIRHIVLHRVSLIEKIVSHKDEFQEYDKTLFPADITVIGNGTRKYFPIAQSILPWIIVAVSSSFIINIIADKISPAIVRFISKQHFSINTLVILSASVALVVAFYALIFIIIRSVINARRNIDNRKELINREINRDTFEKIDESVKETIESLRSVS